MSKKFSELKIGDPIVITKRSLTSESSTRGVITEVIRGGNGYCPLSRTQLFYNDSKGQPRVVSIGIDDYEKSKARSHNLVIYADVDLYIKDWQNFYFNIK